MAIINLWPCPGIVLPVVIVVLVVIVVVVISSSSSSRSRSRSSSSSSNSSTRLLSLDSIFFGISGLEYFNCHRVYYCHPPSNIKNLGKLATQLKLLLRPESPARGIF